MLKKPVNTEMLSYSGHASRQVVSLLRAQGLLYGIVESLPSAVSNTAARRQRTGEEVAISAMTARDKGCKPLCASSGWR